MPQIREHRSTLRESLATMRVVHDHADLVRFLQRWADASHIKQRIDPDDVTVSPYGGIDPRCGWDTYLIEIRNWGVWGMSNAPGFDELRKRREREERAAAAAAWRKLEWKRKLEE